MSAFERAVAEAGEGNPVQLVFGSDLRRAVQLARQALENARVAEEPGTEADREFRKLERLTIRGELNSIVESYE